MWFVMMFSFLGNLMPMEIVILLKLYFTYNLAEVIIFTTDINKNGFESSTK